MNPITSINSVHMNQGRTPQSPMRIFIRLMRALLIRNDRITQNIMLLESTNS